MKRKSFLTVCFLLLCSLVYGQWTYDPASTQHNMNAFVCVSVCGEEQNRADFEIAAFYGDKVRGVTRQGYILPINGEEYVVYFMTIGGDNPYEEITFKLYDPVTGRVYHSLDDDSEPFYFIANSVAGDITAGLDPIALDFYHWNYEYDNTWDQTMTIYSTVYIDGNLQEREDIEIAAMCNGKVRSVSHPIRQGDKYILYLYISGNANDYNKDVTFMLYDHYANEGIELLSDDVTKFVGNNFLGTIENPFVINFRTPYVAKIGDVKYETLQEAVTAYNEGETIVMLKNAQSETADAINKDVTIDFAGFTYDGTLDINATLNVVGTAGTATSMVLNEGAQIYHSYALATTIVRNVDGTEDVWGTLSAPTAEAVVVFDTEGRHDFYQYVEPADLEWEYIEPATNEYEMRVGRGYLYANKENVKMSFVGTLNMESVGYALSHTEGKALAGFNMIGNPFTHNITLNHLQGEIANAFYSVDPSGAWVPNVESPVIAPFQAVLVQTNAAGNTLAINKTENTASTSRSASEGILKINVANNSYNDVAYVLFEEGIGLRKIGHFNEEIPMVSVSVEDKDYAVATMSKDVTEIPVSFKAMTMGQYTISVEAKDCEFDAMYLTDKLTGENVNLNTASSYTFMATSNDNPDRFVLTMTTGTTGIEQNAECFVYVSNDEIRFNNINGQVNVRIYDMLGRPVAEYDVYESATISTSSFERGMYILQMTDENGVRTQKVLVD